MSRSCYAINLPRSWKSLRYHEIAKIHLPVTAAAFFLFPDAGLLVCPGSGGLQRPGECPAGLFPGASRQAFAQEPRSAAGSDDRKFTADRGFLSFDAVIPA